MSNARFGAEQARTHPVDRALAHLEAAQEIIDEIDRPEIGARIEEAMEAVRGIARGSSPAAAA